MLRRCRHRLPAGTAGAARLARRLATLLERLEVGLDDLLADLEPHDESGRIGLGQLEAELPVGTPEFDVDGAIRPKVGRAGNGGRPRRRVLERKRIDVLSNAAAHCRTGTIHPLV